MKTLVRRSAVLALIGFVLSPLAVAYASSSPADSVHFCQLIDFEQWQRDRPRPAGKRLALNVGEPRTVRMIYFLPNDRPFRQEVVDSMKVAIRRVQTFYAEQMQAHGYGNRTFRFETGVQGEPLVHRVDGRHSNRYYRTHDWFSELWEVFDPNENIYNIITDTAEPYGAVGNRYSKNGGYAWLGDIHIWGSSSHGGYAGVTAHELGHAFGLLHDFRDDAYIMSYGSRTDRLSACAAEFLSVHPYFNSEIPTKEGPLPTLELISPRTYPAGSESVPIQLKVADSQGIHQVILFGGRYNDTTVKACHGLSGERDAIVEFEYDGMIPSYSVSRSVSNLSDLIAHPLRVQVVDSEGNVTWTDFVLSERTQFSEQAIPQTLTKVSGDGQGGQAGAQLAKPFVVSVLDQDGSPFAGAVVSFSVTAGGGTLSATTVTTDANGRARSTLTLGSDPGANTVVATVAGLGMVTFTATVVVQTAHSLTKVSGDGQEGPASTQLAAPFVVSVLDQDGSALAGVDVTFAVSAGGGTLSAVSATTNADGHAATTLTLGSDPGTNTVEAAVDGIEVVTFTATITEQTSHSLTKVSGDNQEGPASAQLAAPFVVSVLDQDGSALAGVDVTFAVSAGGGMLSATTDTNPCTVVSSTSSATATTDANGRARIRLTLGSDLGTNTVEATVEGLGPVTFTATAAEQATPHSLTKVCGDDQEGTAGALLAEPFVVSVVDEDGAAMAGVNVSFTVTAGGGTLSSATATTNANGRARTWLTLGSELGTNTVEATVEGLEPVTFTAVGQESPLASLFDAFLGGGKRVALPDSPQLLQNAPNPFNSQTVLSYFLHAPGPARLEVFTLTGQRVAVLQQGPQQAGYHRLHWDGRDAAGRPVASGAYLYRLVTEEAVLTRKLILLR